MSQKEPASQKNPTRSKESLFKRIRRFASEVSEEVSQVVWPTRRDAMITTLIVCIFAFLMSLYLLMVDQGVLFLITKITG